MKKLFLFMLPAIAAFASCSSSDDSIGEGEMVIDMLPETRSIVLTQEQRAFVGKNTDFSFNLFSISSVQSVRCRRERRVALSLLSA